jgi:hypothetical protein
MNNSVTTITSIAASFIAVCALIVSVWTGYETRQHNRLSVKPILDIANNTAPGPVYGLILYNEGTGPALVKGWKITFNDELMREYKENLDPKD